MEKKCFGDNAMKIFQEIEKAIADIISQSIMILAVYVVQLIVPIAMKRFFSNRSADEHGDESKRKKKKAQVAPDEDFI